MPKQVILCGWENICDGHLNLIARSTPYTGMQYDDPTDAAYFYKCSHGDHIYYVNAGGSEDSVDPERMRPYTGDLSVAEIMVLIPKHSGSFSMNFDEEKLRQKRLPSVGDSLTLEVELAPFGTGMVRVSSAMVKLPKSWAGKTVIVTVQ